MISNYIVLKRKELGIQRSQLAEDLDISYNYLTLIETNKRKVTNKLKPKLAKALKVSQEEIDYYNDTENSSYAKEKKIVEKELARITKQIAKVETDKLILEKEKNFLCEKLVMIEMAEKKFGEVDYGE